MFGRAHPASTCLVCGDRIDKRDERMRLRGGTEVHRRCATYRMRSRGSASRQGRPVRIPRSDD